MFTGYFTLSSAPEHHVQETRVGECTRCFASIKCQQRKGRMGGSAGLGPLTQKALVGGEGTTPKRDVCTARTVLKLANLWDCKAAFVSSLRDLSDGQDSAPNERHHWQERTAIRQRKEAMEE